MSTRQGQHEGPSTASIRARAHRARHARVADREARHAVRAARQAFGAWLDEMSDALDTPVRDDIAAGF